MPHPHPYEPYRRVDKICRCQIPGDPRPTPDDVKYAFLGKPRYIPQTAASILFRSKKKRKGREDENTVGSEHSSIVQIISSADAQISGFTYVDFHFASMNIYCRGQPKAGPAQESAENFNLTRCLSLFCQNL